MIFDLIFKRLDQLGVIALIASKAEAATSEASGFMELHFDRLYENEGAIVISLAHYFEQNGDLCCDPDMEIRVDLGNRVAEAMTFQQAIPPVYQRVYSDGGNVNVALKKAMNSFLAQWLGNCIEQGHCFRNPEGGA